MLTIGRIVVVVQGDDEIPAIVSEVTGTTCCVTAFPPRRTPLTIYDLPWFTSREKAYAHREAMSAQNTKVAYLPYAAPPAVVSLDQVDSALQENERKIERLIDAVMPDRTLPETAEEWAAARPDLQDPERGRTLPPIRGVLNVPLADFLLKT